MPEASPPPPAELVEMEEDEEAESLAMAALLVVKIVALSRSDLPPPLQKHQESTPIFSVLEPQKTRTGFDLQCG